MVLQMWKSLLTGNCSKSKIAVHLCLLYILRSLIYINVSGSLPHSVAYVTASKKITSPTEKLFM